jgi:hypothetical protein
MTWRMLDGGDLFVLGKQLAALFHIGELSGD